MVNVGVIGLGSLWESRYRPALAKLSQRIRVCAVYDPLAGRAEQVAAELGALPFQGMLALLKHAGVKGILFLDADWHGSESIEFLCRSKKPAFIAGSLGSDERRISRLRGLAEAEGIVIMPEFSRRFTPATSRLHELMATQLGKPSRVVIDAMAPDVDSAETLAGQNTLTDFLVGLIDWCCYVIRTAPISLQSAPLAPLQGGGQPGRAITVEFGHRRSGGESPKAELRIHSRASDVSGKVSELAAGLRQEIFCERGHATIEDAATIEWQSDAGVQRESLTADRTEIEVMLDHFCRRVVGGLIPVADIADVCRCFRMAQAAEEGLATGRLVNLSGLL